MEKLIEYLNAKRGRRASLAESLHISPAAISQWEKIPAERIGDVSRLTGLDHAVLRPDLFQEQA